MHVCVYLNIRNHRNYPNLGTGCWYTGLIAIITIIKRANKGLMRTSKERKSTSPPCLHHLCISGTHTLAWVDFVYTLWHVYTTCRGEGSKQWCWLIIRWLYDMTIGNTNCDIIILSLKRIYSRYIIILYAHIWEGITF